jgi:hypothetical protein
MHTWDCPQIWSGGKRIDIGPRQVPLGAEALQLAAAVDWLNGRIIRARLLHNIFVLFMLQRTSGVPKSPSWFEPAERGAQDLQLTILEIDQIVSFQPPLDLGLRASVPVPEQGASTNTRSYSPSVSSPMSA